MNTAESDIKNEREIRVLKRNVFSGYRVYTSKVNILGMKQILPIDMTTKETKELKLFS